MKVIAITSGFKFGRRIRPGEEFDVGDKETASWFKPAEEGKRVLAAKAAKTPAGVKTLSQANKAKAAASTEEPRTLSEATAATPSSALA